MQLIYSDGQLFKHAIRTLVLPSSGIIIFSENTSFTRVAGEGGVDKLRKWGKKNREKRERRRGREKMRRMPPQNFG